VVHHFSALRYLEFVRRDSGRLTQSFLDNHARQSVSVDFFVGPTMRRPRVNPVKTRRVPDFRAPLFEETSDRIYAT